jgi:hypothetical protein
MLCFDGPLNFFQGFEKLSRSLLWFYHTISSFRFREVANLEADLCLLIRIPVWIERALSTRLWSFNHLLRHRIDLLLVAGCLYFHFGAACFHIGEPLTSCSSTTSYPSGPSCSSQTQSLTQLTLSPWGSTLASLAMPTIYPLDFVHGMTIIDSASKWALGLTTSLMIPRVDARSVR